MIDLRTESDLEKWAAAGIMLERAESVEPKVSTAPPSPFLLPVGINQPIPDLEPIR